MAESVGETQDKPIGVIDALSAGYRALSGYWYLALIPFLLDIFFWLGPQISPWAAVQNLLQMADPEVRQVIEMTTGVDALNLSNMPDGPNLLTALVQGPGSPGSLAASLGSLPKPPWWEPVRVAPSSLWGIFGLIVALLFLGTPVAGLYMALAARAVSNEETGGTPQARAPLPFRENRSPVGEVELNGVTTLRERFWETWAWATLNLAALVLIGILLFGASIVGLSMMAAVGLLFGQGVAVGILGFGSFLMSWIMVMSLLFFYFTPASIVLQHAHALKALARSALFVFRNLWGSVGLVLISMLISEGFALIWRRLFFTAPGVVVSMAGNAYLTTGLTLSALIFFQDRFPRMKRTAPSSPPVA